MHDALFAGVILPLAEMVVAEPLSGAIGGGGDDAAALASGDNLDAKMVDGHALLRVKIVHCKILPGRHARNKYLLSKNSHPLPQQRREATYKRAFRSFSAFLSASLPSIFIVNIPLWHPRNLLPPSNSGLPRSVAFPSAPSLGAVPALCGHGAAGSAAPTVLAMEGKRNTGKKLVGTRWHKNCTGLSASHRPALMVKRG